MKAEQIRSLFQYHFDTNRQVWAQSISQLTDEQFVREISSFDRSVRDTVVHMIDIDKGWFLMLQGEPWRGTSDPALYPDRERVGVYRDKTDAMMGEYLDQLDDAAAVAEFSLAGWAMENWQALMHVITHGVNHRSRLLAMLDLLGVETMEQDLALYLFGGEWPGS